MCLSQWRRMTIHDGFLNQVGSSLKRNSVTDAYVEFSTLSGYNSPDHHTLGVEYLAVICFSVQAGLREWDLL